MIGRRSRWSPGCASCRRRPSTIEATHFPSLSVRLKSPLIDAETPSRKASAKKCLHALLFSLYVSLRLCPLASKLVIFQRPLRSSAAKTHAEVFAFRVEEKMFRVGFQIFSRGNDRVPRAFFSAKGCIIYGAAPVCTRYDLCLCKARHVTPFVAWVERLRT